MGGPYKHNKTCAALRPHKYMRGPYKHKKTCAALRPHKCIGGPYKHKRCTINAHFKGVYTFFLYFHASETKEQNAYKNIKIYRLYLKKKNPSGSIGASFLRIFLLEPEIFQAK